MPRNVEYLIAAYGIVIGGLSVYATIILLKLRKTGQRLKQLNQGKEDE